MKTNSSVPGSNREPRRQTPPASMQGLYQRAIRDAVRKLDPRTAIGNPVMFLVWVGTIVTLLVTIDPNLFGTVSADIGQQRLLNGSITPIP
jgi:potassium-transporting ATPase ATP-binding subunit